jgi:amidase
MRTDLWTWDATTMAAAIASREVSSREVVAACLDRMAAVNPRLNAVTVDLGEEALAAADRADAAVARSDGLGPLHGVPIAIKENVDQAGAATANGVVAFRDLIAAEDSPVVANLRAAGAVIIGRTNTPAFSFRLDTDNALRGRTSNPWSATHTPGGSSGGASAAVAAGVVPIAHGNDIAGSIRFPAYACGLAGLRPSFGRVPAFNATATAERSPSSQLLSVQGPIARTVRDLRLALQVMSARDARDPWWVPAPLEGAAPDRPDRAGGPVGGAAPPHRVRGAPAGGRVAGGRGLRDRGHEDAWVHARGRAVVRDADPGDSRVHVAADRRARR